MKKRELNEQELECLFAEISGECMYTTEASCGGGGSVTEGVSFSFGGGRVYW